MNALCLILLVAICGGCRGEETPADPPGETTSNSEVSYDEPSDGEPASLTTESVSNEDAGAVEPESEQDDPMPQVTDNRDWEQEEESFEFPYSGSFQLQPDVAYVVVEIRPSKILDVPAINEIPGMDLVGEIPIKPSEVERLMIVVMPDAKAYFINNSGRYLEFAVLCVLNRDVPQNEILQALSPNSQQFGDEAVYLPSPYNSAGMVIAFPDEKTIVVSPSTSMGLRMLAYARGKSFESPAFEAFDQLDPEGHLLATMDVDHLRHFWDDVDLGAQSAPENGAFADMLLSLPHSVTSVSLQLNLDRPDGLSIRLVDENGPEAAKQHLESLREWTSHWLSSVQTDLLQTPGDDVEPENVSNPPGLSEIANGLTMSVEETAATLTHHDLPPAEVLWQQFVEMFALQVNAVRNHVGPAASVNHLMNLVLAVHNHHSEHQELPQNILSDDGTPLLSWRVQLLPFLEEHELYESFRLDEPWDSPHNKPLIDRMPKIFHSRDSRHGVGKTHFQAISGQGTVFGDRLKQFDDITDGMDGTLAFIEAESSVVWTKPDDVEFDPEHPLQEIRDGGSWGVFYNGARIRLSKDLDPEIMVHACLYADGIHVDSESATRPKPLTSDEVDSLLTDVREGSREEQRRALFQLDGPFERRAMEEQAQAVVDQLIRTARSDDPNLRLWALETLLPWSMRRRINWKELEPILQDRYDRNRWLAIQVIGLSRDPEVVSRLITPFPQDSPVWSMVILGLFGEVAADSVVSLLASEHQHQRTGARMVIAMTGDRTHIPQLEKLLDDEDEDCRKNAEWLIRHLEEREE